MKKYILLLSGGVGSRYESDKPKQYTKSRKGGYYIVDSIRPFLKSEHKFDAMVVVCAPEYVEFIKSIFNDKRIDFDIIFANNGSTRQESINNGIDKINEVNSGEAQVFIQEAVRPFVSTRLINELVESDKKYGSVSASVNPFVLFSKFNSETNEAYEPLEKADMVELQLPKRYDLNKYNKYREEYTGDHLNLLDESIYFIESGETTHCIKGSFDNIKVTRPIHRWIAEAITKYNDSK